MIFTERYKDIIKTEAQLSEQLNSLMCVENNRIEKLDIVVTGHFGNTVSVDMLCENVRPIPLWNSTSNIGYILRALIEILDKEEDRSVSTRELDNTPIRIVYDNDNKFGGRAVAIGHPTKDRFVLIEDLMKVKA